MLFNAQIKHRFHVFFRLICSFSDFICRVTWKRTLLRKQTFIVFHRAIEWINCYGDAFEKKILGFKMVTLMLMCWQFSICRNPKRFTDATIHLQLLLVNPHTHHDWRNPNSRERSGVFVCRCWFPSRCLDIRNHCRKYRFVLFDGNSNKHFVLERNNNSSPV